jgi:hypothetical protein
VLQHFLLGSQVRLKQLALLVLALRQLQVA